MISYIRCRINDVPYLGKFVDFVLQSVLVFLHSIENESPFTFIFQLKIDASRDHFIHLCRVLRMPRLIPDSFKIYSETISLLEMHEIDFYT